MSLYILSDPYGANTEQLHSDRCDDDTMALVCKQGTPLGKHGAHVLPEFDVEKDANLPTTVDLSLYTTAECSVDETLESEASGRETSERSQLQLLGNFRTPALRCYSDKAVLVGVVRYKLFEVWLSVCYRANGEAMPNWDAGSIFDKDGDLMPDKTTYDGTRCTPRSAGCFSVHQSNDRRRCPITPYVGVKFPELVH